VATTSDNGLEWHALKIPKTTNKCRDVWLTFRKRESKRCTTKQVDLDSAFYLSSLCRFSRLRDFPQGEGFRPEINGLACQAIIKRGAYKMQPMNPNADTFDTEGRTSLYNEI
jgi:hypothetical protein